MKRILFVFTLFVFTAVAMQAQEEEKTAVIVAVDGNVYDFGEVNEADGPVVHTFKIKNEGNAALVITRVVASCGCTTPEWTEDPIAAGKTGEIKVTFGTENRPGPFTKTISIYSNGKAGSFILTIKGKVIPKG